MAAAGKSRKCKHSMGQIDHIRVSARCLFRHRIEVGLESRFLPYAKIEVTK